MALFTGISFSIWFVDALYLLEQFDPLRLAVGRLGRDHHVFLRHLSLAGFLPSRHASGLCPYARIRGPWGDSQTIFCRHMTTTVRAARKLRRGGEVGTQQGDLHRLFSSACKFARPAWISETANNWGASLAGC